MKDNGVSVGCNPPANTQYCPNDDTSRGEMAVFLKRLSENKIVDAATAVNADNATNADDADKLDGKDSTAFVQKGEANSVSSSMMTDSPGVAQTLDGGTTNLTVTPATVLSVDIDAPAAGFVLVQATYEMDISHVNGTQDVCRLDVSAVDNTLPADGIQQSITVPSSIPSGLGEHVGAALRIFPVGAAGTHTFYLVGQQQSGSCGSDDVVLTAMYVPVAHGALSGNLGVTSESSSETD